MWYNGFVNQQSENVMIKYISSLVVSFLLFCSSAFSCQEMSFDPWLHFVNKKEFYDSNDFMLWHYDGDKIYGAHMIYAGKITSDRLYDCQGSKIATKKGNNIYDERDVLIFKIDGNKIYNSKSVLVATIRGNVIYNEKGSVFGKLK